MERKIAVTPAERWALFQLIYDPNQFTVKNSEDGALMRQFCRALGITKIRDASMNNGGVVRTATATSRAPEAFTLPGALIGFVRERLAKYEKPRSAAMETELGDFFDLVCLGGADSTAPDYSGTDDWNPTQEELEAAERFRKAAEAKAASAARKAAEVGVI